MTKLICITGARHIGKTTVLETLIPTIIHSGSTVAAVKYSTHAHEIDTPGKNSWRLKKAGAEVTAMVTPKEIADSLWTQEDSDNGDMPDDKEVGDVKVKGLKTLKRLKN